MTTPIEQVIREDHMATIAAGLRGLVVLSGKNSRDHGFHEDWPVEVAGIEVSQRELGLAITEKLALIHEEISEALGEIRSGRDPLEVYFVDKATGQEHRQQDFDGDGKPMYKPEGFLVELADAAIRIGDLVYLVKGREQFITARAVKHEYNATRPYKHGRKF
jgi:hypothetical protein